MQNYEINLTKRNKKSSLKQNFCKSIQDYKVNLIQFHFMIYDFGKKKILLQTWKDIATFKTLKKHCENCYQLQQSC